MSNYETKFLSEKILAVEFSKFSCGKQDYVKAEKYMRNSYKSL